MASTRKRSARIAALQKENDAPEVEKPSTSTSKQSEVEGKRSPKTVASKRKQIKKEEVTTSALVKVDEYCPEASNYHVYCDADSLYDCMLNQTNISQNNNKFYSLQLLESNKQTHTYAVWLRWGRVGAVGQTNLVCFPTINDAQTFFKKKFTDKTKNRWENRHKFEPHQGKYDFIHRDYNESTIPERSHVKTKPTHVTKKSDVSLSKSELPPTVQDLMQLIFDVRMMAEEMEDIGYDARKMPLGQLTPMHIRKGYDVLKEIANELAKPKPSMSELSFLSSRFYTIIPHDFGRQVPPVIRNRAMLKSKLDMVETLGDIEIATSLLAKANDLTRNPIDSYYLSLKCAIRPLDPSGDRYHLISTYLQRTHAATHSDYSLEIVSSFEVERQHETDRFRRLHNRQLLWHGSRLSNWVGILSQGLRIAPPEAPVTGYMFGKGIYFADMVSKSANYCFASPRNPFGLLILCEVALGDLVLYTKHNYEAEKPVLRGEGHSSKGCGQTEPDPGQRHLIEDDVVVPLGPPVKTNIAKSELLYNEYIVYQPEQARMRYLLQVKFNYRRGRG